MSRHCASCVAEGRSSHAIARAFGHCPSGGTDHPYDPSDLIRCIKYCDEWAISDERLAEVMAPVSPTWAALVENWGALVEMLDAEIEQKTGTAALTYAYMQDLRQFVLDQTDRNFG